MFLTVGDRLKELGFVAMSLGAYQLYMVDIPP
ncbi:hypothetical protein IGK96_002636 [Enterococcus sp. DIV0682]